MRWRVRTVGESTRQREQRIWSLLWGAAMGRNARRVLPTYTVTKPAPSPTVSALFTLHAMHVILGLLVLFVLVPLAIAALSYTFRNAGDLADHPLIQKAASFITKLLK